MIRFGGQGLTLVEDELLKRLLALVHKEQVPMPLTKAWLMASGFATIADSGDILVGLDERALRVVLVAVLAERNAGRA